MNSYNHYSYGAVVDWIYSVAGGIKPDKAGFDSVIIEPQPTDRIEWLETEYNSWYGKIMSKWTNTGNGVKYEIETPVSAKIIINGKERIISAGSYEFEIYNEEEKE